MDILADYNNALLTQLNANGYLAAGVPAVAIGEDLLEEDSDDGVTAEAHLTELNQRKNATGVAGILSVPEFTRQPGQAGMFTVNSVLIWYVNKKQNMSADGCQKPIGQIVLYSVGSLDGFVPQIYNDDDPPALCNPFRRIAVTKIEYLGEMDGTNVVSIEIESMIALKSVTVEF